MYKPTMLKKARIAHLSLLVYFIAFNSFAQPFQRTAEQRTEQLNVLTYNTGLLRILTRDMAPLVKARGRVLPAILRSYTENQQTDIILLEEVWNDRHAQAVQKILAADFEFFRPHDRVPFAFGSGLLLAIRKPFHVLKKTFIPFRDHAGVQRFTRKGIVAAILEGPSHLPFLILGFHTQAFSTKNNLPTQRAEVRAFRNQSLQIEKAAREWSDQYRLPVLLLGDFNVGPGYVDEAYRVFSEKFGFLNVFFSLFPESHEISWDPENPLVRYGYYPDEPPAMIDHCFVRNSAQATWILEDARVVLDQPQPALQIKNVGAVPLSDHYGLSCRLRISSLPN